MPGAGVVSDGQRTSGDLAAQDVFDQVALGVQHHDGLAGLDVLEDDLQQPLLPVQLGPMTCRCLSESGRLSATGTCRGD